MILYSCILLKPPARQSRLLQRHETCGSSVNHIFFLIMRVYTPFFVKNYLFRTIGRDCRPNRRKIGATLLSARFQNTKAADAFFIPLCVSVIFRTR